MDDVEEPAPPAVATALTACGIVTLPNMALQPCAYETLQQRLPLAVL